MKRTLSIIALGTTLAVVAGTAFAGGQQSLAPVSINGNSAKADCTPPSDAAVCTAWHQEIRRNFSNREIGMLFGARTTQIGYTTGGYDRVKARYDTLQSGFAANFAGQSAAELAAK